MRVPLIRREAATRIAVLIAFLAPLAARASDGVVEINQASALAGGVTPADAPGFPVTLSQPGSYALTSDLAVVGLDTTAIQVSTSHVTLDLRGHTIDGGCPATGCSTNAGTGVGINAFTPGVTARNGRVRLFARAGVQLLGERSRAVRIAAEQNGANGISMGEQADVADSIGSLNMGLGIQAGPRSTVRRCRTESNFQGGILVEGDSIVSESSARWNTFGNSISFNYSGITVFGGSLVRGNDASSNFREGIELLNLGNLVIDNVTAGNQSNGISAPGKQSLIHGNASHRNQVRGLALSGTGPTASVYRENVVSANPGGTVLGGVGLGANVCNATASCP